MTSTLPLPQFRPTAAIDYASGDHPIVLPEIVRERLLAVIAERLPLKSFGVFISYGDPRVIDDFVLLEANTRNSAEWKHRFEAYGQYFLEHEDAGFVSTPEESFRLQKLLNARGMVEIGLFHSHLRHPGNFSQIDYDMHMQCHGNLWHMIISVRNSALPQLRVFDINSAGVREQNLVPDISAADRIETRMSLVHPSERDQAIADAQALLDVDASGRPICRDSRRILNAIANLHLHDAREAIRECLTEGLLAGSAERFRQHIAPLLQTLPGGRFHMGTNTAERRHFVGEFPRRAVEVSPFRLASIPVTEELFAQFQSRCVPPYGRDLPAVNVSWYDATLFALWMGCRLPTEAEWEYACGAGSPLQWASGSEHTLSRMAWYSDNAAGHMHPVRTREPNAFGLFDLHGNVWEWCQDSYQHDFYAHAPAVDPLNQAPASVDKVCRGGSFNALAEMCRTSYRFHEPADFHAGDLGFRLAADCTEPPA